MSNKQKLINNSKYEILTPNGWEDFEGIIKNDFMKKGRRLFWNGGHIDATLEHRFYKNNEEIQTNLLTIGDKLDSIDGTVEITKIEEIELPCSYDIFNSENHIIITNTLVSHQCDELAFLKPTIANDFYSAILPTLSSGGECIITSTPNSDEDLFARIWKEANNNHDDHGNELDGGVGRNGFYPLKFKWDVHPDRGPEFEKEFRASLTDEVFDREFNCEFISAEETLINSSVLKDMKSSPELFKLGEIRWFKEPEPNNTYLVALDPSTGTGGDYAAIQVFEMPSMVQVAEWKHNKTPPKEQVVTLMHILYYIYNELANHDDQVMEPSIYWTVENNGIGESILTIISETDEENFPGIFVSEPKRGISAGKRRKGLNTSNSSKLNSCSKLKSMIETNRLHIKSSALIKQLKAFVRAKGSFAAQPGEHDDLVTSLLLILRLAIIVANWEDDLGDAIKDGIDVGDDDFQPPMPMTF